MEIVITGERHFDGREMTMVHDMFRREFGLLPGLISAMPPEDLARAPTGRGPRWAARRLPTTRSGCTALPHAPERPAGRR
jgi:hypothetical protein